MPDDARSPAWSLKPATLAWRISVAWEALSFFSPLAVAQVRQKSGDTSDSPLRPRDGRDFARHLREIGSTDSSTHPRNVLAVLDDLERSGLLYSYGSASDDVFFPKSYYSLGGVTRSQARGELALAAALGPALIIPTFASVTVPVSGIRMNGEPAIGSGLVVSKQHILTCAHVVDRISLDERLVLPIGSVESVAVRSFESHDSVDVAIIEVDPVLRPPGGLAFRDPEWTDVVTTYGFPRVPLSRRADPVVQAGEVVNPSITTFDGHHLLLFSATARPGNSGGPIVAADGRVIGIVTRSLELGPGHSETDSDHERSIETKAAPFFAGLPSSAIADAVRELGFPNLIDVEDWSVG